MNIGVIWGVYRGLSLSLLFKGLGFFGGFGLRGWGGLGLGG